MKVTGEGRKEVLILAEAPGEEEDRLGTQLIGKAGQLLRGKLSSHGLDLDKDFWKINAVNCRPTDPKKHKDNREPTKKEILCCRPRIISVIQSLKPKIIWCMGSSALYSLMVDKFENDRLEISSWKRTLTPDEETGAWVLPLFHPSALLQNKDACLEANFDLDLKYAVSALTLERPEIEKFNDYVEIVTDFNRAMSILKEEPESVAIDYETSGLKPYKKGNRILSIGLSSSEHKACAFPLQYPHWDASQQEELLDALRKFLTNPKVEKVAHNIKFEHKWAKNILGVETTPWLWDTCLAQHILDSRKNHAGLKFQALIRWGVVNYGKHLESLKTKSGPDGFNSLHKAPLNDLLLYNGLDALFCFRLFKKQPKELRKGKLFDAYDLLHDGTLSLSDSEDHGICINEEFYKEKKKELMLEAKVLEEQIMDCDPIKEFTRRFGRTPNLDSPPDLRSIFFVIMGEVPKRVTAITQAAAVTEEVLLGMKNEVAKKIIQKRKIEKIISTYIGQFEREVINGKINPLFSLETTETFRSSSEKPNFQNIPKRDEKAKKAARSGIVPRPNHFFREGDYKMLEVCIMACYTHDPVLIRYIKDKTSDMHRDQAMRIFQLPQEGVTDQLRGITKGDFVFAQFYGDWYRTCAENLWEDSKELTLHDGTPVHDHLSNCNIGTRAQFEKHIQAVENHFWDLLRVSRDWRESVIKFYKGKGHVDSFFGFRRSGYLRRNQIFNAPVQGTAFHCLLWSYNKLHEYIKTNKLESVLIGQIHDAIIIDVKPEEGDVIKKAMNQIMTKDIQGACPWLIVPLEVKITDGEINASWSTM